MSDDSLYGARGCEYPGPDGGDRALDAGGHSRQAAQQRYLRGSQGSSDVSIEVEPTTVATITALATDNDSGVQRLELFALVTIERVSGGGWFKLSDHVSNNFGGVTSTPVPGQVPFTVRMSTTIDFGTLSQGADWVIVDLAAVATSGAPPASNSPAKTNVMTLYWKRAGTPP